MMRTRRGVLKGAGGAAALGTFAGCLSAPDDGTGDLERTSYAAFFALEDWVEQLVGDEYEVETPLETGEVGHGWQADFDLQAEIARTDAFVYLDTPSFGWAQDVAAYLADETDVALIDGMDGLEERLLPWDDHDDGDGHDDLGDYDPHVWLDPVLARDVVDTIADGLSNVYPEDAATFEENAEAYASELDRVDEAFRDLVANARLDGAVLAAHDSFRYLEARYGFDLHAPVGVSPDDRPREGEIADTIAFVDDHGIETILYDAFDAPERGVPRLARTILEDSTAEIAEPVTPLAGTLETWREDGLGWVEQMEEINLPAFRKALQAR